MKRELVSSGTEWEPRVSYSRAVKAGRHIHISGTTATDDESNIVGKNDPYEQTQQILTNIEWALNEAGAALSDVVRTRIFVTSIDHWEEVGDAHADTFGDIRPSTSLVEVSELIAPDALVEIEATAIMADESE
jgi:enamine deaminase RidA (YjgF/YER057c/UK114 family)